jgi:hypothetical protein
MRRMAYVGEHPKVCFRATRNPVQVSALPGGGGRPASSTNVPAARCLTTGQRTGGANTVSWKCRVLAAVETELTSFDPNGPYEEDH